MSYSEGRGAAAEVDAWLSQGSTRLPNAGGIKTRVRFYYLDIHSCKGSLNLQRFVPPPSQLPTAYTVQVGA